MLRNRFQKDLDALNLELISMGALIERIIDDSVKALVTQNKELCNSVLNDDKELRGIGAAVESKALKILLTQQPVASDLRMISTALKIVTDLERIGKQAGDICGIVLMYLCDEQYQPMLTILPLMGETARNMVHSCVNGFVKLDTKIAEKVIKTDDEMDELFAKLKEKMVTLIKEAPEYADQAICFMMIGKYFEKIGDHAENIAEWVVFAKTGEHRNIKLI